MSKEEKDQYSSAEEYNSQQDSPEELDMNNPFDRDEVTMDSHIAALDRAIEVLRRLKKIPEKK